MSLQNLPHKQPGAAWKNTLGPDGKGSSTAPANESLSPGANQSITTASLSSLLPSWPLVIYGKYWPLSALLYRANITLSEREVCN